MSIALTHLFLTLARNSHDIPELIGANAEKRFLLGTQMQCTKSAGFVPKRTYILTATLMPHQTGEEHTYRAIAQVTNTDDLIAQAIYPRVHFIK